MQLISSVKFRVLILAQIHSSFPISILDNLWTGNDLWIYNATLPPCRVLCLVSRGWKSLMQYWLSATDLSNFVSVNPNILMLFVDINCSSSSILLSAVMLLMLRCAIASRFACGGPGFLSMPCDVSRVWMSLYEPSWDQRELVIYKS